MEKYIVMALISSFIGIMANPEILMATDRVKVAGLSDAAAVETVVLEAAVYADVAAPRAGVISGVINSGGLGDSAVVVMPDVPANNIQIAGRTIEVVPGGRGDAGGHVNYNGRLLAGHNSSEVFGGLSALGVGSVFTVTVSGVATTYQVSEVATYAKADLDVMSSYICGDGTQLCNTNLMGQIEQTALGHSVALMTCAGTMYGNGDASHRLVLLADAI